LRIDRSALLVSEPIQQMLEGRGERHDELRAVGGVPDLNQPGHRIRRQGAQAGHQRLVLRRRSAHQEMHGHVALEPALPGPEALGTLAGQRFNQLVLLMEVHGRSVSL
jgi:hypothetical protein